MRKGDDITLQKWISLEKHVRFLIHYVGMQKEELKGGGRTQTK